MKCGESLFKKNDFQLGVEKNLRRVMEIKKGASIGKRLSFISLIGSGNI
jgi:DNA-directed RNA polymerase sigma subunit (sigma70/sigma32)